MIRTIPDLTAFLTYFKADHGTEWAFHQFWTPPASNQFIVWIDMGDTPMAADNVAYFSQPGFAIELYSKKDRAFEIEAALADALTKTGTYFRRLPAEYLESEGVWLTPFYI